MNYSLIRQTIQFVSLLLIIASSAQARLYCRENTENDARLQPKDRMCFRGQTMIFDIDGDQRVDDSERDQACSSGRVELGFCGTLSDQGNIHERCLIGHIMVCRYCDLSAQENVIAFEGHIDTSIMSAQQYCNARNRTPEHFDKVVYTREEFHQYRLNPLKKKFVDVVFGFAALQQMFEQTYEGTVTSEDPVMSIPSITYPDGKLFVYSSDLPTDGTFVEDPENPNRPNLRDEFVPFFRIPADTELGYRNGFSIVSQFNFSDKNRSGQAVEINPEFQATMYNWLDHTQDVIKGEGGLLELLDNMGTSTSVAWARDKVAKLNQKFDSWQALSYGLNPSNYDEWKRGLEELKMGYLLVYTGAYQEVSPQPTLSADTGEQKEITPIEEFYYRPQTN